jgi:hypothetical protein
MGRPHHKTYAEVMMDAWSPELAAKLSRAMQNAIAKLGWEGAWTREIMQAAWESDPELRKEFGAEVSKGLLAMWANPAARARQSERTKKTYIDDPALLDVRRSQMKSQWADPKQRAPLAAGARRKKGNPAFRAKCSESREERSELVVITRRKTPQVSWPL